MTEPLLMPKATAVWLVENTSLTFEQIAEFCGLHPLEVQAIADGEARLGTSGRVVIRNSGTEPVIRVKAQGEDEALLADVVGSICEDILAVARGADGVETPAQAAE